MAPHAGQNPQSFFWIHEMAGHQDFDEVNTHGRDEVVGVTGGQIKDGAAVFIPNNQEFLSRNLVQGEDGHANTLGALKSCSFVCIPELK